MMPGHMVPRSCICVYVIICVCMYIRLKLRWLGHISRSSGLAKTIERGAVNGNRRSRQKKNGNAILRSGREWTLLAHLGRLTRGLGWEGVGEETGFINISPQPIGF